MNEAPDSPAPPPPTPVRTWQVPPRTLVKSTEILPFAPRDAGELAAWLAGLTYAQFDTVWVVALVESAEEGGLSLGVLAAVTSLVRERYRNPAAEPAVVEPDPTPKPDKPRPTWSPQRRAAQAERARARWANTRNRGGSS